MYSNSRLIGNKHEQD